MKYCYTNQLSGCLQLAVIFPGIFHGFIYIFFTGLAQNNFMKIISVFYKICTGIRSTTSALHLKHAAGSKFARVSVA